MKKNSLKCFAVAVLLCCSLSQAHKPIFTDEKGIDPETAVRVDRPDLSQVIGTGMAVTAGGNGQL